MPQLTVRNVEESVVRKLRALAKRDGVSVEEEHRRLLRRALRTDKPKTPKNIKDHLLAMPYEGPDDIFVRPKRKPRKVEL